MIYIRDIPSGLTAMGELSTHKRLQIDTETFLKKGAPLCTYNQKMLTVYEEGKTRGRRVLTPMAVDPHTSEIRLIQLGTATEQYVFDLFHFPVQMLKPLLEDPEIEFIGHNLNFEQKMLRQYKIKLRKMFDTMIAAQVFEAGLRDTTGYSLLAVAERVLGYKMNKAMQSSDWSKWDLSDEQVEYAADDVRPLIDLRDTLYDACYQDDLDKVIALEMAFTPCISKMEYDGVLVDTNMTKLLLKDYTERMAVPVQAARDLSGMPALNLSSPAQVMDAFLRIGITPTHPMDGKPGTDKECLEQVDHPLAEAILEYRKLSKLITTYLTPMPTRVHPITGMVHTSFTQAHTETGRLSSRDPNVQQIPSKSEEGKALRECFIAPEGQMMVVSDYSQIEMRLMAMMSKDPVLCKAIKEGADIHDITTQTVFGVQKKEKGQPGYEHWLALRYAGKTMNFSIAYGISGTNLAAKFPIAFPKGGKQADKAIDTWFQLYGGVRGLFDTTFKGVIENSIPQSRSLLGRRRCYPKWMLRNKSGQESVRRQAQNHIIQGSAADIMKAALIEAYRMDLDVRLTVHDEIILYTKPENAEENAFKLEKAMHDGAMRIIQSVDWIDLEVPIEAGANIGTNWANAK